MTSRDSSRVWPPSEMKHPLPFSTALLKFISSMNVFTNLCPCQILKGNLGWYIVTLSHTRNSWLNLYPRWSVSFFSSCLKANTLPSPALVKSRVSTVGERNRGAGWIERTGCCYLWPESPHEIMGKEQQNQLLCRKTTMTFSFSLKKT